MVGIKTVKSYYFYSLGTKSEGLKEKVSEIGYFKTNFEATQRQNYRVYEKYL